MSERSETKRPWPASRWTRLNGPQRIAGVDLARGLAVIGMLAAHLLWIEGFDFQDASTWVGVAEGRSSILFATLAGVSIGLVTGGARPLPRSELPVARGRLALRAGLLWLLGVALILTGVPVYVILPAYAILFLLALPLLALRARPLFVLTGALVLVMPFVQVLLDDLPFWQTRLGAQFSLAIGWNYPFPVWMAFITAGLGIARCGILRARVQLWMLGLGSAFAALGYGLHATSAGDPASEALSFWEHVWTAEPHSSGLLEVVGSGGFAVALLGLCLLACRTVLTWVVLPLRAVGTMPLTAYTAQLVVWAVAATILVGDPRDLAGFRDLEPLLPLTLTIVIGCTAWTLLIGRGPLEWMLDRSAKFVFPRR